AKRVEVIPPGCPAWRALSRRHNRGRTVAVLGATHATAAERAALRNLGVAVRRVNECASGEALADRVNREADVVVVFGGAKSRYLTNVAIGSGLPVVVCGGAAACELPVRVARVGELADAITNAWSRPDSAQQEAGRAYCESSAWPRVAALHHALWRT